MLHLQTLIFDCWERAAWATPLGNAGKWERLRSLSMAVSPLLGTAPEPWRWHLLVQSPELCVGNAGWHRHSISASWSPPSLCQSSLLGWNGRKGRQIRVCKAVLWKWKSLGISKISIILSRQSILSFCIIFHPQWDCPCEYYKDLFQLKMLQTPPLGVYSWDTLDVLSSLGFELVLAHFSSLSASPRAVVQCHTLAVLSLCWNEALPAVPRLSGVTAPCAPAQTPGSGRACSETRLKEGPVAVPLLGISLFSSSSAGGAGLGCMFHLSVLSLPCAVSPEPCWHLGWQQHWAAPQVSATVLILKFCNYSDCYKNSFFVTSVSLSWCCCDSLLGGLENCSRLPKLMQQLSGNLTYFRAALTWLRMCLRLNCNNINFPLALGKKWFIMKIGGLCCEGE